MENNKGLFSTIVRLAWPTILEQLMQTLVQYVDLIMVGALGTAATAAVGATTTVNWLVNSSIAALGVGFLAYIARALGAGDNDRARRASAQAVLVTLAVGVLFTAVTLLLAPFVPGCRSKARYSRWRHSISLYCIRQCSSARQPLYFQPFSAHRVIQKLPCRSVWR